MGIDGNLRKHMIRVPKIAHEVCGIEIFGRRLKTIVFSTDIAQIRNVNADAVLAVYPFTPQPIITQAIMLAADMPVFAGVGGGMTGGSRCVSLAMNAEQQGAMGVVLNSPAKDEVLKLVVEAVDIPVVVTIVSDRDNVEGRIMSGASILNVSAADQTPKVVAKIKKRYPNILVMATGGPTEDSIKQTIYAGADAITWTPPTTAQILRSIMEKYRDSSLR